MTQNVDLRIRRTLIAIRDAFIELLIERGFDHVTVQAITKRAHINRATFYRHYKDKHHLAEQLTDLLFADVEAQMGGAPNPTDDWHVMFEHIAQYAPFYRAMMSTGGIPNFKERIQQSVEAQMQTFLPIWGFNEVNLQMPLVLPLRYIAAAQVGFMQWWLENDMPFPPQQAASYLLNLHHHGGLWALGLTE